jgi:hypothetical protein
MSKTGLFKLAALFAAFAFRLSAQHAHVNAGVTDAAAGSRLAFLNASRWAEESGYVVHLNKATNGPYAGYHVSSGYTFTALSATDLNGGVFPGHAALGSHLVARLVSVEGPVGGSFGFWETPGDELDAEEITFGTSVGEVAGTREFPLSENNGRPGEDPYGHYHGRKYTATLPGLYKVGLVIRDASHNGPGGGPLHPESEITRFNYQAGVTIAKVTSAAEGTQLTFATKSPRNYHVEASQTLSTNAVWTTVAGPIPGDDHLASVTIPSVQDTQFFRLRVE